MEQFDTLLAELTVREMLLYTAELKCSLAEPLAKKKRRVDSLLETLALERCANTLIGDSLARGISGGQVSAHPENPSPAPDRLRQVACSGALTQGKGIMMFMGQSCSHPGIVAGAHWWRKNLIAC